MTILDKDQSVDAFLDINDIYFKTINNDPNHTNTMPEQYTSPFGRLFDQDQV